MIDSHHHLWQYRAEDYPWIPPESALAQDYLVRELEQAAGSAGVTGTVVVQARQTLAESDWLLSLADRSEMIRGVVGWVPLSDPQVGDQLQRLASYPKFKGVRHVLQDEPSEFFSNEAFHRGLGEVHSQGLRYDLLVFHHQIPLALRMIDRHPDLRFIVDHLAKPAITNGSVQEAWITGMKELAKRPNVVGVKVSGLVTEVRDPAIDEATLGIYFDKALAIFGVERLMFGTDWPVCLLRVESYKRWVDMVGRFLAPLSSDERTKIRSANCDRIYALTA